MRREATEVAAGAREGSERGAGGGNEAGAGRFRGRAATTGGEGVRSVVASALAWDVDAGERYGGWCESRVGGDGVGAVEEGMDMFST